MSQWFRMYAAMRNDPKVQRLPGDVFKAWVNMLCLAAEHDGVLPSIADIAFDLRLPEAKARKIIATLRDAGLLDVSAEGMEPHNWRSRQYKSDVSTTRVKRFRERSKERDETVSETPPEQNRAESETEEKRISVAPLPDPLKADFEVWYASYPLHKGRGQAEKTYRAARKKTDAATLLEGAKRYALEGNDPKFIAHPATWLNGERWADEPAKPGERKPMNGGGGGGMVRDSAAYDDMILKTRAEKIARGERLPFRPAPEQIRRMVEQGWLSDVIAGAYLQRNGAGEG